MLIIKGKVGKESLPQMYTDEHRYNFLFGVHISSDTAIKISVYLC